MQHRLLNNNVFIVAIIASLVLVLHSAHIEALSSINLRYQRFSRHHVRYSVSNSNFDEDGLASQEKEKEYLATCIPGLAPYLEEELRDCGVFNTEILSNAAVSFSANDNATPLKVLLWVRTAHRILEKIDTFFDIESRDDVYNAIQHSRMHVKDLLGDGEGGLLSLSVKVIANGRLPKDIAHSHFNALQIKHALVDQIRDLRGDRPDVELDDPDVPLVAIMHSQGMSADMTLYRSLSPPGSLHRRGYRSGGAIHKAAMKESLAAGLLLAAGWQDAVSRLFETTAENGRTESTEGITLVDPMCGSGSLLVEAAMISVNFAPGLMRIINNVPGHQLPPILRWKGNKETLLPIWKEMLLDASTTVKSRFSWLRENDGLIKVVGNDIHSGALELVEASLQKAGGLDRLVDLQQNDCEEWEFLLRESQQKSQVLVVTNPPWGVRLSDDDHESWESLRNFLRTQCPKGRTEAWVLSGNKAATKHLGLRRSQSVVLKTGEQDLRWIQYMILDKAAESSAAASPFRSERKTTMINSNLQSPVIKNRNVRPSGRQRPPIPSKPIPSRLPKRKKRPIQKVSDPNDSWI